VGTIDDGGLELLRRRRAELREAMTALEQALAAPAPGRTGEWAVRVHVALVELSADMRTHLQLAEGPEGLHQAVLAAAPRLSAWVRRLHREHDSLTRCLGELLDRLDGPVDDAAVEAVRAAGTSLLAQLARHRQRSADLVFEAYQADIGGET
jgi:hypothetical protein